MPNLYVCHCNLCINHSEAELARSIEFMNSSNILQFSHIQSCIKSFFTKNIFLLCQVHVDDCVVWLNKFKKEGKKFDMIINDLTAIPVTKNLVGKFIVEQFIFLQQPKIQINFIHIQLKMVKLVTNGDACQNGKMLTKTWTFKLHCIFTFYQTLVLP